MSRNVIFKIKNFLMLSILLPVISGCGGSDGGSLASLFGGSSPSAGAGVAGGGGVLGLGGGGGGALPTLSNPEPATLLLLGSGMVVIGYLKRHKK